MLKREAYCKNILNTHLAQLVPAALLVLIGIVVIWTASMNIAEASVFLGIFWVIILLLPRLCGAMTTEHYKYDNVLLVGVVVLMILL